MGHGQVAAGRQGVAEGGDDGGRVFCIGDKVQYGHQEQGDGPGEVKEAAGLPDNGGRVTEVSQDDLRRAGAGEQGLGVRVDDRVNICIHF